MVGGSPRAGLGSKLGQGEGRRGGAPAAGDGGRREPCWGAIGASTGRRGGAVGALGSQGGLELLGRGRLGSLASPRRAPMAGTGGERGRGLARDAEGQRPLYGDMCACPRPMV
jgi:hypothetical protein